MLRLTALLLTVLTGATGLVYEVTWQKYLATLLGSHAEATAAVLGIFLAGLSAGYWVFGSVSRRIVRRAEGSGRTPPILQAYGVVEGGIGAWAFLFPTVFALAQDLAFRVSFGSPGLTFAFDVALSALLILPPTVLMGGTIPLLTQGLSRSLEDATRLHAFVYAFNTAGAFFGALAAGFALIPWLGLHGVMAAMGTLNLGVGVIFLALGRRAKGGVLTAPAAGGPRPAGFVALVAVAVLSGFAMMAVQTVLNRIGALALGSSPFTFAMVAAVFVACIALGSFLVSSAPRIPRSLLFWNLGLVFLWFLVIYGVLDHAPFWTHVVRLLFSSVNLAFYPYYGFAFVVLFAVVGPGVVLSGATLPLLFHDLKHEQGDLGRTAGVLYSWNTVGSLLGALGGGTLLLQWLDLHHVYRIALLAMGAAFVIVLARTTRGLLPPVAAALFVLGAVGMAEPWNSRSLSAGLFRFRTPVPVETYSEQAVVEYALEKNEILFYDDDPTATIAVLEGSVDGVHERSILHNAKSDSSTLFDYPTTGLLALLPALLSERLESAFVVGYGTGVTVGELAALATTTEVVVAEISPAVVDAAPFFETANQGALASSKLRIIRSDAYRALMRGQDRYDAIISEPSNPWMAGIEMLFSREFLAAARSRLRPGGVFVQWYHMYETGPAAVDLVLRTYTSVFPDVAVWYGLGDDLLLVGFTDSTSRLDLARIEARARRPDIAAGLRRCGVGSIEALVAHEILPRGVLAATRLDGPLHTLFHPRLTYVAGQGFFQGSRGELPFTGFGQAARVGARRSLLRQLARRHGGEIPDGAYSRLTGEACSHRVDVCTALLADWARRRPDSPALAAQRRVRRTRLGHPIEPQDVQGLGDLLAGRFGQAGRPVALARAEAATSLYRHYYHHGVPFEPEALREVWRRCRAPKGRAQECRRGSEQAQQLLSAGAASGLGR